MPPSDSGGRSDVVYDITCFQCDSNGNCNNRQPCDGRMQYWPKKENNKLTHVTLTGLQPNTSYVLRVAAENGVSYLYGPNSNRIVEIQFGTKISGKDRKVCLFFVFLFYLFIHFWLGGGVGAKRDVCSFIYTHISSLALYFELFNGGKRKIRTRTLLYPEDHSPENCTILAPALFFLSRF